MNTPSNAWMNEPLPKWIPIKGTPKAKLHCDKPSNQRRKKNKYDPKKHSWHNMLRKKTKEIKNQKVIFSGDKGRPSLTGFKPAKIKSMSYQEYAEKKIKIDGLCRGF